MKFSTILLVIIVAFNSVSLQASPILLDTVYLDNAWKQVDGPCFASYYKIFEKGCRVSTPTRFRNFYITGEIQGDGYFIKLDSINDLKSLLEGEFTSYYRDGRTQHHSTWKDGALNGELCDYNPDGTLIRKVIYKNGLPHGLSSEFSNGICYQQEFYEGKNLNGYYTMSNPDGLFSKISINENIPILQSPEVSEMLSQYINDVLWKYYIKDGLTVEVSMSRRNDYGKYYRTFVRLTNNSFFPIEINPELFTAAIKDKKGYDRALAIQNAEQYDKRIKRTQNWETALTSISAGLASTQAGYSVSSTNSYGTISYGGNFGTYSGTSTTTTYNASEAIQTQLAMSQSLMNYTENNAKKREARNEGYLKHTTIKPGECLEGYFNILRKDGQTLYIYLNISDAVFQFQFDPAKK